MSWVWNNFWGRAASVTPHCNAVGRFVPQLQRITIKFCKSKPHSQGVRDYIEQHLIHYARTHPHVVVYLKPRRHKTPVIKAEYVNGNSEFFSLNEKPVAEVHRWIHEFSNRSGNQTAMLDNKFCFTDHVSTQGTWTPFTHRHPSTFNEHYPNEEGFLAVATDLTATEQLLLMKEKGLGERPSVTVAKDTPANMMYRRRMRRNSKAAE